MLKAREIYKLLNNEIPVCLQEKWDNSGFLVGDENKEINKIVVCLDIGKNAVLFAAQNKADMIISHHPVIFDAIKSLDSNSIPYMLAKNEIAAICLHTPLDMSKHGMNEILFNMLKNPLDLGDSYEIFEPIVSDDIGFGFIAETKNNNLTVESAAKSSKSALNALDTRYYDSGKSVRKIAVCSGSGASMLEDAVKKGADTLVTGDVKHDRWIAAENYGFNLIDCGHYYTENVCLPYLASLIKKFDNSIEVIEFNNAPYKCI